MPAKQRKLQTLSRQTELYGRRCHSCIQLQHLYQHTETEEVFAGEDPSECARAHLPPLAPDAGGDSLLSTTREEGKMALMAD